MYIPAHFAATDAATLHDIIRQFSFATLVTAADGAPVATHLPFLLDPDQGGHGVLLGHMARANTQWHAFDGRTEALVVFLGEHGYISPAWYTDHPSVPTWNYAAVHAYGRPRVIEDADRIRQLLERLVVRHESGRDEPWSMELPTDYMEGMVKGIVAFEIPMDRLEGKLKMSQNRSSADQQQVMQALATSSDRNQRALAARMAETRG